MTQTIKLTAAEKHQAKIQAFLDTVQPVVQDPSLPHAIITDIDGTLAHMEDFRKFSEWDKVGLDSIDNVIKGIVQLETASGTQNFITSGRDEECASVTAFWLHEHEVPYTELLMRKHRDPRPDVEVKFELFMKHIFGKVYVKYVLDDRQQVVDLWRKMGITCLQVAQSPD